MKPGLSLLYLAGSTPRQMFSIMERFSQECGIWELIDDGNIRLDRKMLERLSGYALSYGFKYSIHAPFTDLNIASLNSTIRKLSLKAIGETLKKAYKLNAKTVVIHPGFKGPLEYFYPRKALETNLKSIRILLNQAENLGVRLTVENMPKGGWPLLSTLEEFEKFFQEKGLRSLGLALDVGHAQTVGQVKAFIKRLNRKISHVHLHDNFGSEDSHLEIGDGSVNWASTIKALKKAGFSGYLIIESIRNPPESLKRLKGLLKGLN
ncbi:TPA: sugar phosphate isomerase/epimerase [Candidatus Bathyarchaeota archaeon]|nr:sugar phosphate isomerase/epimerase [Candidatus Bathyarchaeota archaeon]